MWDLRVTLYYTRDFKGPNGKEFFREAAIESLQSNTVRCLGEPPALDLFDPSVLVLVDSFTLVSSAKGIFFTW